MKKPILAHQEDIDAFNKCIQEKWLPLSKGEKTYAPCALCDLTEDRFNELERPEWVELDHEECNLCILKRHDKGCGSDSLYDHWYDASKGEIGASINSKEAMDLATEMVNKLTDLRDRCIITDKPIMKILEIEANYAAEKTAEPLEEPS